MITQLLRTGLHGTQPDQVLITSGPVYRGEAMNYGALKPILIDFLWPHGGVRELKVKHNTDSLMWLMC